MYYAFTTRIYSTFATRTFTTCIYLILFSRLVANSVAQVYLTPYYVLRLRYMLPSSFLTFLTKIILFT